MSATGPTLRAGHRGPVFPRIAPDSQTVLACLRIGLADRPWIGIADRAEIAPLLLMSATGPTRLAEIGPRRVILIAPADHNGLGFPRIAPAHRPGPACLRIGLADRRSTGIAQAQVARIPCGIATRRVDRPPVARGIGSGANPAAGIFPHARLPKRAPSLPGPALIKMRKKKSRANHGWAAC
jgi:hypothetical protein